VVQCAALNELRISHHRLSDPGVHVDLEHPDGPFADRVRALVALLSDARYGSVPWSDAVLIDAYSQSDPRAASLVLAFAQPVSVPTILGVPDEREGEATTTTDARGYGQFRPVDPDEARQFRAAHEVEVGIDLRGRVPQIVVVKARTEPTMCRLSEVPEPQR
jgi:hypothetical protein